ncbi:MAG: right-handed parallel beta-helix repeat-containing protein, partial [Candidatus Heimdallarchaeota archaeon]|nr:right-handed parallel beta-helix repeat-containing protein [Candidatus Heimdallarchaeota archaeon]
MHIKISRQTKIAFITIFLLLSTTFFTKIVDSSSEISISPVNHINYTTSDPLYITNDSDLAGNATSGDGSASTPYIIEGLSIITGDTYAIYISGTTFSFIIRDCYIVGSIGAIYIDNAQSNSVKISNNILSGANRAIRLETTDYTNITDNICQNSGDGMWLDRSDHVYVENNTCTGGNNGIYSYQCSYTTYIGNKIHSNSDRGLWIAYNSDYNNITNNKVYSNGNEGIFVDNSVSSSITLNECYLNNYNGIYVLSGSSNTFENNYLHNNNRDGIKITSSTSNTVANNTLYNNDW